MSGASKTEGAVSISSCGARRFLGWSSGELASGRTEDVRQMVAMVVRFGQRM
jgi:hypothetical protein